MQDASEGFDGLEYSMLSTSDSCDLSNDHAGLPLRRSLGGHVREEAKSDTVTSADADRDDHDQPHQHSQSSGAAGQRHHPHGDALMKMTSHSVDSDPRRWMTALLAEYPVLYYLFSFLALLPTAPLVRSNRFQYYMYASYRCVIAVCVMIGGFCTIMAFVAGKHAEDLSVGWAVSLTSWLAVWLSFALSQYVAMYYFHHFGAEFLYLLRANQAADSEFPKYLSRMIRNSAIGVCTWSLLEGLLYGAYWYPSGNDPAMVDLTKYLGSAAPVHALISLFMVMQIWFSGSLVVFCSIVSIYCRPVVMQLRHLTQKVQANSPDLTPRDLWAHIQHLRLHLRSSNSQISVLVISHLAFTVIDTFLLILSQFLTPPYDSSEPAVGLDIFSYTTLFMRILIVSLALLSMSDVVSSFELLVRTVGEASCQKWNVITSGQAHRLYMYLKTEEPVCIAVYSIMIPKKVVWITTAVIVLAQVGSALSRIP